MALFRPNVQRLEATGNISSLVRAASHQDPGIRREAVRALGRFRDREVYGPLIRALKDEHGAVRMEAIHAICTIRDPAFATSLLICLKDPDPSVRILAIRTLGSIGSPEVIKPLILSMGDSEKEVRIIAVEVVTSLGEVALPELRKAIRGMNQLVRQNVLNVLAGLKRTDFLQDIIEAVEDPVTTVRENAIWALGVIGDPAAVPCLEKNDCPRARRSLKQIREGQNWRTVAVNYEKAGRYEDAAAVCEMKGEWEEAGRLRKLTRVTSSPFSIPQILANSLNFSQDTIIRDSVINRSTLGKGTGTGDGMVRTRGIGEEGSGQDRNGFRPPDVSGVDAPSHDCTVDTDVDPPSAREASPLTDVPPGPATEGPAGEAFRVCPFCGNELRFTRKPVYCPYCTERL